jgi:cytochrome b561
MLILNTEERYGAVSKIVHFVVALLIISMLTVGFVMANSKFNPTLYFFHKSFGVLVLSLVSFRILWTLLNKKTKIKSKIAKLGHLGLYIFMFLMPISGLLMSLYKGYSVKVFNLFTIQSFEVNEALGNLFNQIHEVSAILLVLLIVGHVFMALFHQFILKDGLLKKMF